MGQTASSLGSIKLPSRKEVLALFFYYKQEQKQTIRQSCNITSDAILEVWSKARIPTKHKPDVVNKIEYLFREWEKLKKNKENKAKRSESLERKENEWKSGLDDLFDIAHANSLEMIKINDDREFLLAQREKGRRGKMGKVDVKLAKKEEASQKRSLTLKRRLQQEQDAAKLRKEIAVLKSSSEDEDIDTDHESAIETVLDSQMASTSSLHIVPKRGRKNIIDARLAATLDAAKVTDRNAAKVLVPTITKLGDDPSKYNVNPSSIRRQRMKFRQSIAENLKTSFRPQVPLTIHWDGKMLEDITGREMVDRLPILVSGEGVEQILAAPKLLRGTGEATACAVYDTANEWQISDKVKFMCFDTTAANTGPRNGACVLLEQKLDRDLLWLACRHHVHELVLEAVVNRSLGASSGPDISLFKRFQKFWTSINKTKFQTALSDVTTAQVVSDIAADSISFAENQLQKFQLRDDYKELLELSVIFLGGVPVKGVSFKYPAGVHRARWMAKAIYSLKIWMFRSEFELTSTEEAGVRNISLFVVKVYMRFWFQASSAVSAPRNDLLFLKEIDNYSRDNADISSIALKKLLQHLWYLSEELVILALFDDEVSNEIKRSMVQALERTGEEYPSKRITLDPKLIHTKELADFVTSNSRKFFTITGFSSNFLTRDVTQWEEDDEYRRVKACVRSLRVVNDTAERGVALMEEYNKLHTTNEEQKQFMLLVVKQYRQQHPDSKKSTLMQ